MSMDRSNGHTAGPMHQGVTNADAERIAASFEMRAVDCRLAAVRWRKDFGDCREYRANLRRARNYEHDAKEVRAAYGLPERCADCEPGATCQACFDAAVAKAQGAAAA